MRALLVALLCAPTIVDAGPCAVPTVGPVALTPPATTIAKDGGVIVSLAAFVGDEKGGEATAWRFRDGKLRVKPSVVTLAPGLMVLQLPASGGDALVLENAAHVDQVAVKRGGTVSLLAAPRVRRASVQRLPGSRASFIDEVVAELIAAPPTEAMAVVVFGIDDKQATTARSWTTVDHEVLSMMIYRARGRCEVQIPGTLPSSAGDHLAFAWVDRSGRLSTMSAAVTVAGP